MKVITMHSLRKNLTAYLNEVSNSQDAIIVSRNKNEYDAVVMISVKEYNSLNETAHLLATAANSNRPEQSIEQLHYGKVVPYCFD